MRKKIIGILVCMLVITTAVPAVTSLNNSKINTTISNTSPVTAGGIWIEAQKLLASDGAAGDQFGTWADLSGDTVVITSVFDDDLGSKSGSAHVFVESGTTWSEQAKLLPSDGAAGDQFAYPSIDGDTIVIGAVYDDDNGVDSGSAYVFTRSGTTWTQQAKLLASDGQAGDNFGCCVSLNGNTVLIGAHQYASNDPGAAYVFTRSNTTWTEQQKLTAPDASAGDRFGGSVSVYGDTALIGAYRDDDIVADSGSVYVFTRTGTTWTQQQKLTAPDPALLDEFGRSVKLDHDTALISVPFDDDKGVDSGSAYVFTRTGTIWAQQQKILASDGEANDSFSDYAVSLDGDTAIIGSGYDDDNGPNSGSAYVFTRTGSSWTEQQKLLASDGAVNDQLGTVTLQGDTAIITAWYDDDSGINSGSAYVFTKTGLTFNISGGIGVKVSITNEGTSDVNNVPWEIHVQGGMLKMINKTVNGTIDVPSGKSVTVKTGMLLGFGTIDIAAWVSDMVQVTSGKQFIILTTVKK